MDNIDDLLDQFVKDLHVRTKATSYRGALRKLHDSLGKNSCLNGLTQSALRRWLRGQLTGTSLRWVIHRAQLVARFLDWLAGQNAIPVNPFAELRKRYECRSTAGIVRALISADPSKALEGLRPLPRYGSHLGPVMRDHIQRMRSLGFQYGHENEFLRFDRFLQTRLGAAAEPLSKLIREYAAAVESPASKLKRLRLGNIVARALTRNGIATPSIVPDRLLLRDAARKSCRPFIYSHEQIELLLKTARAYPSRRAAALRPVTLYTMLVMAYCAGLRIGEIAGLELRDIDLTEGTIEVRDTKFFKSRRLPLSPSAATALRDYIIARRKAGASEEAQVPLFVHEKGGYSQITAGALLRNVIRRAGLSTVRGRGGPRIHDIRHTFVVHRMTQWYREGVNPQSRLHYLATYLGHRNIHSTLIYLTITQELLHHANDRFRAAEVSVLKAVQKESLK
ncbi:MAG: tyrosine-type recombinase/integrase [Acidobacteriota bacterium]|nr:tyrosine-type recombinase/integrase [Acidobacteriota bacterium]